MMLSAELFDYIFSFLQRDRAALNSCSAAHPFLFSLAERHLFVHIVIFLDHHDHEGPPPTGIPEGFLVPYLFICLSERPYLANHVRSITIDGRDYPKDPETFEKLSTILSLIQQARRFSFHNFKFFTFPEIFHSASLNCLRTPHMKEVSIRNMNRFPMAFLDGLKNLKILELDSSLCNFTNCANTAPTSLEYLSLTDVHNAHVVTWWAERKVNGLIALHAKAERSPFPDLSLIFNACLESLRSLSLGIGDMCAFFILDPYYMLTFHRRNEVPRGRDYHQSYRRLSIQLIFTSMSRGGHHSYDDNNLPINLFRFLPSFHYAACYHSGSFPQTCSSQLGVSYEKAFKFGSS